MSTIEKEAIKKLDLCSLTDQEIYILLKKYKLDIGPVTKTTRSVYIKRLNKFLENSNDNIQQKVLQLNDKFSDMNF